MLGEKHYMTTLIMALKETKYDKVLTKVTKDQYSWVQLEQAGIVNYYLLLNN